MGRKPREGLNVFFTCKTHKSDNEMNVLGYYLNALNSGLFRILCYRTWSNGVCKTEVFL